ncbi:hypothetical protein [Bremerella alba]|uniref:Uncharacterized protein n=1 Tax=Bremerella alba TaxID=980252 RepID=A0A7V8V4P2_9BACT|nr:hypothetical protein [Bremerella alba]MBA2114903.1 hypothetical protein [Bremerella alba]
MTLIQGHPLKSQVCLTRLSAHLIAAALLVGGMHSASGQDAAGQRWSTNNPPTPASVHASEKPQDKDLRRLPPIDQEGASTPKPSFITPSEKTAATPEIAAKPQSVAMPAKKADPVNWSSPKVVIGPEGSSRTVSHEELVAAPQPQIKKSRYSSALQPKPAVSASTGQSRFTQAAPEKPKPEAKPPASKSSAPVFARVFDEEFETPGITQPEVATTNDDSLSPIFACRLLGLRATKSEANTLR